MFVAGLINICKGIFISFDLEMGKFVPALLGAFESTLQICPEFTAVTIIFNWVRREKTIFWLMGIGSAITSAKFVCEELKTYNFVTTFYVCGGL